MEQQKNLLIAAILSMLILFGWQEYMKKKYPNLGKHTEEVVEENGGRISLTVPEKQAKKEKKIVIKEELKDFSNSVIFGNISNLGLKLDNLTLDKYAQTKGSEEKIHLLKDEEAGEKYKIQLGWFANGQDLQVQNKLWKEVSGEKLSKDQDLVYKFENRDLSIERVISLDENYMFSYVDRVYNKTKDPISLNQYGTINKHIRQIDDSLVILHEGLLGVFNETLLEEKYKKLIKKGQVIEASKAGWIGVSDKYWLSAIIPDSSQFYNYRFTGFEKDELKKFQADFKSEDIVVNPGHIIETKTLIYAGAKEIGLIDSYQEEYDIVLFDRAIDFGVLYFLTKPIYLLLKFLFNHLQNFGLAIIALTVIIRIFLYPLASKSFKEISKIRNIHPELTKLKETYGSDRMRLNREVMQLYQAHKIKPMMGCLPVFFQVFIFFALYKVLFIAIDMRHAEFYGWIHDLTAPDPTSILNLFGLLPFDAPFQFGVWPLLLGISMILQQKLNPAPTDPMQAKMMKFLPYFFTFLFAGFPAGLVIYWTFNNSFSILQQYLIMRQTPKDGAVKK